MDKIKLFIVDDHKLFVEGVNALLSEEVGFELVGFSQSAQEFLENALHKEVDVYIIDINMPDISGIELTKKIKEHKPAARILAVTMYDDYRYIEKMIKSGASGYILKAANLKELITAINTVAKGEKFLGNEIQQVLFNKIGSDDRMKTEAERQQHDKALLSKREIEILSLIAKEYNNQQIAEKLFISERTVETHRKNIFSKTKVRTVIGLVKYAIKQGLIDYE